MYTVYRYTAGYDTAAAACGDNFLPAGFTEFAGWSDSAKQILRFITHKGDCLKADEKESASMPVPRQPGPPANTAPS